VRTTIRMRTPPGRFQSIQRDRRATTTIRSKTPRARATRGYGTVSARDVNGRRTYLHGDTYDVSRRRRRRRRRRWKGKYERVLAASAKKSPPHHTGILLFRGKRVRVCATTCTCFLRYHIAARRLKRARAHVRRTQRVIDVRRDEMKVPGSSGSKRSVDADIKHIIPSA